MKRDDQIFGCIWFLLGGALAAESVHIGIGEIRHPGTGFMGFLVGASLGAAGLVLALSATYRRAEKKAGAGEGQSWRNVLITLASLLVYILLLEQAGFLLTTFFLLFVLFKVTAPGKWLSPLLSSIAVVLLSYLIFFVWLKVTLPQGWLGLG